MSQQIVETEQQFYERVPRLGTDARPVLLSGACNGADTAFHNRALALGHGALHFLFKDWNQPGSEFPTRDVEKHVVWFDNQKFQATETMPFTQKTKLACDMVGGDEDHLYHDCRIFFQVHRADIVYVVAYRAAKPIPDQIAPDVGGGTALATAMYIQRFQKYGGSEPDDNCRLYFFDMAPKFPGANYADDSKTKHKWNRWDVATDSWLPLFAIGEISSEDATRLEPPAPKNGEFYAGIGSTHVSAAERETIFGNLFEV